jgi:hypothetical protein
METPFSSQNNALMLNTLIQMMPVIFINMLLISNYLNYSPLVNQTNVSYIKDQDFLCLPIIGLFCSLTSVILGETSYEIDKRNRGNYFAIAKKYNPTSIIAVVCTYLGMYIYLKTIITSTFANIALILVNVLALIQFVEVLLHSV